MTDRVFEDQTSFEVSSRHSDVEFYLFKLDRAVKVNVTEGSASWDSQNASFIMTAEEATRLKEFLIRKGY
jgi:hypothetical protein